MKSHHPTLKLDRMMVVAFVCLRAYVGLVWLLPVIVFVGLVCNNSPWKLKKWRVKNKGQNLYTFPFVRYIRFPCLKSQHVSFNV
jgi:hypothetical protein